jgi:hypothetical protein
LRVEKSVSVTCEVLIFDQKETSPVFCFLGFQNDEVSGMSEIDFVSRSLTCEV